MTASFQSLKNISWNGVTTRVPDHWEISRIHRDYLLFEDDGRIVFEIRWGDSGMRARFDRVQRRLIRRLNQGRRVSVSSMPVPASWPDLSGGFETAGYAWQAADEAGCGLILACRECRRVTAMQFHRPVSEVDHRWVKAMLEAFADHSTNDRCRWEIFDIRATVPSALGLNTYRFHPGRFEIHFSDRRSDLIFYRWSPASVYLEGESLTQLARRLIAGPETGEWTPMRIGDHAGARWMSPSPSGHRRAWMAGLTGRPRRACRSLWHDAHRNRLMGVAFTSRDPIDTGWMDDICRGYESISQTRRGR